MIFSIGLQIILGITIVLLGIIMFNWLVDNLKPEALKNKSFVFWIIVLHAFWIINLIISLHNTIVELGI
jgi:hypothetical protein